MATRLIYVLIATCLLIVTEIIRKYSKALYTEACAAVKTDAELSESFTMKVGLHQGSVLSPLLSWMLSPVRR